MDDEGVKSKLTKRAKEEKKESGIYGGGGRYLYFFEVALKGASVASSINSLAPGTGSSNFRNLCQAWTPEARSCDCGF